MTGRLGGDFRPMVMGHMGGSGGLGGFQQILALMEAMRAGAPPQILLDRGNGVGAAPDPAREGLARRAVARAPNFAGGGGAGEGGALVFGPSGAFDSGGEAQRQGGLLGMYGGTRDPFGEMLMGGMAGRGGVGGMADLLRGLHAGRGNARNARRVAFAGNIADGRPARVGRGGSNAVPVTFSGEMPETFREMPGTYRGGSNGGRSRGRGDGRGFGGRPVLPGSSRQRRQRRGPRSTVGCASIFRGGPFPLMTATVGASVAVTET